MKIILIDAINTLFVNKKNNFYKIDRELFKILESFKNKKILVTNADDNQIVEFGLNKSPYEIFTLKHNPNKENPLYFKKFLEKYSLSHKDVVYVEHNQEAIMSANSLGIKTFYYKKDQKDLSVLKSFLLENL